MSLLKRILTNTGPKPYFKNDFDIEKKLNAQNLYIQSNYKKNKNKVFSVIRRSPGAGMFSNFIFVLNHLLIGDTLCCKSGKLVQLDHLQ